MRPEWEFVETSLASKLIQHGHVSINEVEIIIVRRVLVAIPVLWQRHVGVEDGVLVFALVVDRVDAGNVVQKFM